MCTKAQAIQKSYYVYLDNFVKEHLNILQDSHIFIFGAGIRGSNLLWVLKQHQLSDICQYPAVNQLCPRPDLRKWADLINNFQHQLCFIH